MKLWLKVSASGVSGWPRAVSPPVRHAALEKDPNKNTANAEQKIQSDPGLIPANPRDKLHLVRTYGTYENRSVSFEVATITC